MVGLFIFGLGYSAVSAVNAMGHAGLLHARTVYATTRSPEKASHLTEAGLHAHIFPNDNPGDQALKDALATASHVLVSIAPDTDPLGRDPVLDHFADVLRKSAALKWVGYYSTVGVYGDHEGAWVDETSECRPVSTRSKARVMAENQWLDFAKQTDVPVAIIRLAGIYGPGRNAFVNFKSGRARRIIKPGQVFNRIHVADIAAITLAAASKRAGGLFNGSDDEPAPPQDVVEYAAELMGEPVPPDIPFDEAELSPMGRSFYGETKRVSNDKIKTELGVSLSFPTYRDALNRLWEDGTWAKPETLRPLVS
ncbi:MAG: SDR family oxidoreductase [Pseudomonadota bacterium]